jgi:GNAT superfamily N-acetyltransferase
VQEQEILTDLSATSLTAAIEDNALALSRAFGRSPYVDLHQDDGLIWFETDVPFATFNGVVRTRLSPEAAPARIGGLVEHFRARSLPMHWMVSESSRPANLEDLLEGQGLCLASRQAAMAADLEAIDDEQPELPNVEIRAIENGTGLDAWHQVLAAGFELPGFVARAFADLYRWCLGQPLPLSHYVAWLEGEPVACSSLFLAAGVAGLHNVVTLPRARRRGIGTAITRAPLLRARDLGYRAAVLSSSLRGYDLYHRLGFEEYFQESTYFWSGTRPGS